MLLAEDVKICLADRQVGICQSEACSQGPADPDEAAFVVFEVNTCGNVFEECSHQVFIRMSRRRREVRLCELDLF